LQDCLALISAGIKEGSAETKTEKEVRLTKFRQDQLQSGEVDLSTFFALAGETAAGTGRQQTLSPRYLYRHSKLKGTLKALSKLPAIDGNKFWIDVKNKDQKINIYVRYGKKDATPAFSIFNLYAPPPTNPSIWDGDFKAEINSTTISGCIGLYTHNDGFAFKNVDDLLVLLAQFVGHKAPSQVATLEKKMSPSLGAKVRAKISRHRSKQLALGAGEGSL
jgi:hypothetical protein